MTCRKCHQPMRFGYRDHGEANTARRHCGRGLCNRCYQQEYVAGTLDRWPVGNSPLQRCLSGQPCHFCQSVAELYESGETPWLWARHFDVTAAAVARRLYRHRRPELARVIEPIAQAQRKAAA